MTDIRAWLDEGRTLTDKTIPGPWQAEWVEDDDWHEIHGQPFDEMVCPQVATVQGGGENDAAFIADARSRLPQALDALQAILDLHKRWDSDLGPTCWHETDEPWPCPTVRAVQAAIGDHND